MTFEDDTDELREEINSCERYGAAQEAVREVFDKVDIEVRHIWADIQTLFDALGDLHEEIEDLHYEIKDLREENRKLRTRLPPPALPGSTQDQAPADSNS